MHNTLTTIRRARRVVGLAAAGICVGSLLVPTITTPVEAATPSTESPEVASSAARALDALGRWHATGAPVDYAEFRSSRARAATLIAADLGVAPIELLDEWRGVREGKQVALLSALTQLGVPYRSLASNPGEGFDCSGLTIWAYAQAGIDIPRVSGDQIRAAEEIDYDQAEPGDLTYYPGHVSIYVGQGLMVHSPNTGNQVEVRTLPSRSSTYGDAFADEPVRQPGIAVASTVEVPGRDLWNRSW